MFVVDASVWVSYFLSEDAFHDQSRAWIGRQLRAGDILTAPSLLISEIGGAVARRAGIPAFGARAVVLVQAFDNVRFFSVDMDVAQEAAEIATQLGLRGSDAVYVAVALRLNVPLVTWDDEQRQRGKAVTPYQAP